MRIAIAGGTGWVGRLVVDEARAAGHTPVVVARSTGVDLVTGSGLDAALAGADAVVDVSNIATLRRRSAETFFRTVTDRLSAAGARADVGHLVSLSIVGIDRVPSGYYHGKQAQEAAALSGPVPATVLRATQFHEFAAQMLARRGPLVLAPRMHSQPVAAREVARRLVELAAAAPVGHAPDLAGPQPEWMDAMIRRLAHLRRDRRPVLRLRFPGAVGREMAGTGLLPTGGATLGTQTFDDWLCSDARVAAGVPGVAPSTEGRAG
ncbi:SDR family oxidoreductase [Nakamurella endophytica]|uniref:3-beta hydroxysteroid dehydrogenase n=1 Tax=Nakamurella endophytica TaxID=1748367 RepID=A0A917WGE5_9ACTN|nr:SDR family oxidoreductase [Nakamurella endophytica]GGM03077.1 3-beta hydroxysteroid dehydrogenase [Nakamurella endophytica]